MEMSIILLTLLVLLGLLLFLMNMISLAVFGRSIKRFFISPLSNKEFEYLLRMIQNSKDLQRELSSYKVGAYYIKDESWSSLSWTVNSVKLSYRQELRLKKCIERKLLKTELLSKAGDILYKEGK